MAERINLLHQKRQAALRLIKSLQFDPVLDSSKLLLDHHRKILRTLVGVKKFELLRAEEEIGIFASIFEASTTGITQAFQTIYAIINLSGCSGCQQNAEQYQSVNELTFEAVYTASLDFFRQQNEFQKSDELRAILLSGICEEVPCTYLILKWLVEMNRTNFNQILSKQFSQCLQRMAQKRILKPFPRSIKRKTTDGIELNQKQEINTCSEPTQDELLLLADSEKPIQIFSQFEITLSPPCSSSNSFLSQPAPTIPLSPPNLTVFTPRSEQQVLSSSSMKNLFTSNNSYLSEIKITKNQIPLKLSLYHILDLDSSSDKGTVNTINREQALFSILLKRNSEIQNSIAAHIAQTQRKMKNTDFINKFGNTLINNTTEKQISPTRDSYQRRHSLMPRQINRPNTSQGTSQECSNIFDPKFLYLNKSKRKQSIQLKETQRMKGSFIDQSVLQLDQNSSPINDSRLISQPRKRVISFNQCLSNNTISRRIESQQEIHQDLEVNGKQVGCQNQVELHKNSSSSNNNNNDIRKKKIFFSEKVNLQKRRFIDEIGIPAPSLPLKNLLSQMREGSPDKDNLINTRDLFSSQGDRHSSMSSQFSGNTNSTSSSTFLEVQSHFSSPSKRQVLRIDCSLDKLPLYSNATPKLTGSGLKSRIRDKSIDQQIPEKKLTNNSLNFSNRKLITIESSRSINSKSNSVSKDQLFQNESSLSPKKKGKTIFINKQRENNCLEKQEKPKSSSSSPRKRRVALKPNQAGLQVHDAN